MPSYEQSSKNKLWSVRFREKVNGKEINKRLSGFKTKKEAEQGYLNYTSKKVNMDLTFDNLVEAYLTTEKSRIKESSFYDIKSKIENRIQPYFTDRLVSSICPLDVLLWQQTLSEYSYNYQMGLRGHLSSLLRYADRYYNIPSIMKKVDPPRNTEPLKEMKFWTENEFAQFFRCVPQEKPMHRMYFLTLYILGCRKGEALALTWKDIDLDRGIVSITKNITRKVKGTPYAITTPKNLYSNRKINIPKSLCNEYATYRQKIGRKATDSSFVFGIDHPLTDRTTDRIFANACTEAGVKKIRIHDLRHSCASLLISRGVSIVAVSKRLGHKNIEQTLNTYSHMMPSDDLTMQCIIDDLVVNLGTNKVHF